MLTLINESTLSLTLKTNRNAEQGFCLLHDPWKLESKD